MSTPAPRAITALPKGPLTPQQQLEAAQRVHAQAEHRVQLGLQLFKAAEARVVGQQAQLDQIKAEQDALRQRVETDVASSLHAYDQWVGQMDENFTRAIRGLEDRVDQLQQQWSATQTRLEEMMKRSQVMLDQSRAMLSTAATQPAPTVAPQAKAAAAPLPLDERQVSDEEMSIYRTLLRRMQDEKDAA
jgi:hypothetical protein